MTASRYAATQVAVATPRETELRAFRYVNGLLASAQADPRNRVTALHKTHQLWALLMADLLSPGNGLPEALKGNLISLGLWAQREAMARMDSGDSLDPLIALHRDMIEGLVAQGTRAQPAVAAPVRIAASA